jgi:hypothetical protein
MAQSILVGILVNTDHSILNIKLEQGFEIRNVPYDEIINGTSLIGKVLRDQPYIKLDPFLNQPSSHENLGVNCIVNLEKKYSIGYLRKTLRTMRLFKEGNILMPATVEVFVYDNNEFEPESASVISTTIYYSREIYKLTDLEAITLQEFFHKTQFPFQEFIQLAFDYFEFSYHTHKIEMSFLSLMTSLEILFNRGNAELTYRISRNIAVLLGDDIDNSSEIFKNIQDLYGKRSIIVHSGKASKKNPLSKDDILKLRDYVRRSIKELIVINKSKDEILDILNASCFGCRPLRLT